MIYVCPDRDIECGQRPANWCEKCPQRRASSSAAVPVGELPPLPAPWRERLYEAQPEARGYLAHVQHEIGAAYKDAEIAEWRARAAVESNRAQQGEPVAWMCPAAVEPEFTADALLAGYWARKGRTVTPLYPPAEDAREQQPSVGAQAGEARASALEEAAHLAECIGADWLDADDAHKNYAADYIAKAIRGLVGAAPAHPGELGEGNG